MDLDKEKAKLHQHDAEWSAVASEGRDIEAIVSYWTDDAIVIPPDLPLVVGKNALREYVQQSLQLPGFTITWNSSEPVLSADGHLAYMLSNNTVTMNDPDGSPLSIPGRAVTIWRREPDGVWRCAVDIWNQAPTA